MQSAIFRFLRYLGVKCYRDNDRILTQILKLDITILGICSCLHKKISQSKPTLKIACGGWEVSIFPFQFLSAKFRRLNHSEGLKIKFKK